MYDLTAHFMQTVLTEAFLAGSRQMVGTMRDDNVPVIHLKGNLNPLPAFSMPPVPVRISVDSKWAVNPPEIFTSVKWLCPMFPSQDQILANWHRYRNRTLCWIKYYEWREICGRMDVVERAASAAYQLVRNVQVLLLAHWVSYINRLDVWPKELWLQRPHGNSTKEES